LDIDKSKQSASDALRFMLNEKTGLNLGAAGFNEALNSVPTKYRTLEYMLFAFNEKNDRQECTEGLFIRLIDKKDVQARYDMSIKKDKPYTCSLPIYEPSQAELDLMDRHYKELEEKNASPEQVASAISSLMDSFQAIA
jgi:hypothetical protein